MSDSATILVVDDTPEALELASRHLRDANYLVHTADSAEAALRVLERLDVDLVITDLRMPEVDGLDLIRHVRAHFRGIEIIVLTAYATVSSAVTAVKMGASDYLTKPFEARELLATVERVLKSRAQNRSVEPPPLSSEGMLGESPEMRGVLSAVAKAATSDATVLITGESGVGKELVARAIHRQSARALGPIIPVNCGAIPRELFENELFGHARGAFTGATESHVGFFQAAEGGTLFLDEISELDSNLQVKLLRVLQDREVYMIGATRPRKVNVRIVAATGKELSSLVDTGKFRQDLFFRLSVLTISIPPLRERRPDIVPLARHYADKFARHAQRPAPILSESVLEALENYAWPGNVRELENLMQRLVVMADGGELGVPDLPAPMRFSIPRHSGSACRLADAEREHIKNVLAGVGGNKTRAAKILGIDRKTLREKLKERPDDGDQR